MHYCVFLLLLGLLLPAQTLSPVDKTATLIKHNDLPALAEMFTPALDIIIDDNSKNYSKAEAEKVLTDFFKKNRPEKVTIFHRIESSDKMKFCVLMIDTSGGGYRLAVSYKNIGGQFMINELRLEPEKTK